MFHKFSGPGIVNVENTKTADDGAVSPVGMWQQNKISDLLMDHPVVIKFFGHMSRKKGKIYI